MIFSKLKKYSNQITGAFMILAVLVAFTYPPQVAHAAMAFVQGTTCTGTTSPINSTNFAGSVTVGDVIVVTVVDDAGISEPGMTVTDTGGNTYTRAADTLAANSGTHTVWYTRVTTGGGTFKVTVTNAGGAFAQLTCVAQEFGGFTGTATFDKVSAYTSGTSVSPLSGTSGTLTSAAELVVGSVAYYGVATTNALGTGYTNLGALNTTNAASGQESKVVAATTAVTAGFTIGASREWTAYVLTFRDVAAAGGGGNPLGTIINTSIDE